MRASGLEREDGLFFCPYKQADRVLQTLRLIVEYGGTMKRWRGLIVLSLSTPVLENLVNLINRTPMPDLRFLSFARGGDFFSSLLMENYWPSEYATADAESSLVWDFNHPQLAHVELVELPSSMLFRTFPLTSNLTRFQFTSHFISLESVSNLLSETPRLERLEPDIGDVGLGDQMQLPDPATLDRLRVSLRLLSDFPFNVSQEHTCGIPLLKIIDAPNVKNIELKCSEGLVVPKHIYENGNCGIPTYLAKGRVHGALQSVMIPAKDLGCGPIFPLVQKLNLKVVILIKRKV
ncbi:unnamed protein product [Rhizoctonia solani]|uniref:Uncharacterized protein n=1 Tax=Rhizoctonia solani TaxID=456999 RepID=A0A8H3BZE5_9AGAM|nr:unnamed protein product [Rhizoctonia solani]